MHPVHFEKVDQKYDGAAGPGQRVCPGNGGQFVDEPQGQRDIADPDQTPAHQHGCHGHRGLAGTPHHTGDAVGQGQQTVKQADGPHMPGAVIHHLGRIIEEPNELGSKHPGKHTDQLRHGAGAGHSEGHTLLHPVVLLGTQILAYEGGQSLGKAGHRQEGKALDLTVGAAARHCRLAEAVDVALDHQIGEGNDGILDAGGQAETDDGLQTLPVEPHLPELQLVGRVHLHQMDAAKRCADSLGNGGGQGRCPDSHPEHTHKQQIQSHIDKGRQDQIVQRMLAVTHRVVDPHENIIGNGKDGSAEIKPEVADGLGQHILGSSHPPQDGGTEGHTQYTQCHTCAKAEGHIGMDGPAHGIVVLCSVAPGDQHTGTHGHTVEEADEHKDQTAGGADRRQGILSQKVAYTPGVKGIIKLLEHISQENRQGEQQHLFPDDTLGQSVFIVQGIHFLFCNQRCGCNEFSVLLSSSNVKRCIIYVAPGKLALEGCSMTEKQYGKLVQDLCPKSPLWKDCLWAFVVGGAICTLGQALTNLYSQWLSKTNAATAASMSLVALSALLTGLSLYDNLAKYAGAGTLVPITGFANAIASPAIEFKTEGLILGVGAKMFTIAGPVIVYGVSASVVYGIIYWITTLF